MTVYTFIKQLPIIIINYYSTGPQPVSDCSESTVRVGNDRLYITLPFDSTRTYTGRVEVCRNGQYVDVCNNTGELDYFISRACGSFSADYGK